MKKSNNEPTLSEASEIGVTKEDIEKQMQFKRLYYMNPYIMMVEIHYI